MSRASRGALPARGHGGLPPFPAAELTARRAGFCRFDFPTPCRRHSYDVATMTISVNGEPVAIEPGDTVRALLARLELASSPCAVEVNAQVVPRREHADRRLADGDTVEIVTLVGGG